MIIVLDTNIMIQDFRRTGGHFQTLYEGVDSGSHSISIPTVVVEETIRRFREELQKRLDDIRQISRRGKRLSDDFPLFEPQDGWVEQEVAKYRSNLERELSRHNARIVDYPKAEHRQLVERELARRKPFSARGGYRDALIWASVLEVVESADDKVIFVTGNTGDFGDGSGNLHEDLLQDLRDRGLSGDEVILVTSLKDVVERFIEPSLARLEELRGELKSGAYRGVDIIDAIAEALENRKAGDEWEPDKLSLDEDAKSAVLDAVTGHYGFEIGEVFHLSGGRARVDISADFECEFTVIIREKKRTRWDETGVWGLDESYTTHKYGSVSAEATVILDIETGDIASIDFESIS